MARHVKTRKPTEPWVKRFAQFVHCLWCLVWNPPIHLEDGTHEHYSRSLYWTFAKQADLFWRTKWIWYDGGVEEMFKDLDE